MITEDYVSFEIAKLLKEKGFDTPCDRWYSEYTPQYYSHEKHICIEFDEHHRYENNYEFICYAPTLQMAMKWLREVHHCVICITPLTFYCGESVSEWGYCIWAGDNCEIDEDNTPKFKSYEEACGAAIKYCLENLI